jgi:hypothetical protein
MFLPVTGKERWNRLRKGQRAFEGDPARVAAVSATGP